MARIVAIVGTLLILGILLTQLPALRGRAGGAPFPSQGTVKLGSAVSGTLSTTDPRGRAGRGPYQVWALKGKRGQRIAVEMMSSDFDAYLFLRDDAGYLLAQDDDGGGNRNARVRVTLPRTGSYRLVATALGESSTGAYSLTVGEWVAPEAPAPGSVETLALGDGRNGLLEPGDDVSGEGPYQDHWTFDLAEGARVRVEVQSEELDAYVIVLGPDGRTVGFNDDGGGSRNAALPFRADAAGRFTALATTYGDQPRSGAYRIALSEITGEDKAAGAGQTLEIGRELVAELSESDTPRGAGSYVDLYDFTPTASGLATISMVSEAFDALLIVEDEFGQPVARDDDSGGNRNARITIPVRSGVRYRVVAGTFGGGTGSYTIVVSVAGGPQT